MSLHNMPDPIPLIPNTADDKAQAAVARINACATQLQQVIKSIIGQMDREISKNRDKLTPEQVQAALGPDKMASLVAAKADFVAVVNKYAPGTFPTPPEK